MYGRLQLNSQTPVKPTPQPAVVVVRPPLAAVRQHAAAAPPRARRYHDDGAYDEELARAIAESARMALLLEAENDEKKRRIAAEAAGLQEAAELMATTRYELCAMARRGFEERRKRTEVGRNALVSRAATLLQAYVRLNKHNRRMDALQKALLLMDASRNEEAGILARCNVREECSSCLVGFDYQTRVPLTAPCSNMPLCEGCCDTFASSKVCCLCGVDHFNRRVWLTKEVA